MKGREQIHVSKLFGDGKSGMFMKCMKDDACTLYETFRRGSYESNNGPCLGWRDNLSSPYQVHFIVVLNIVIRSSFRFGTFSVHLCHW